MPQVKQGSSLLKIKLDNSNCQVCVMLLFFLLAW